MPRRRPPVEIFTAPVPGHLSDVMATCPMCGGTGQPLGFVVEKLVFRCGECGVRFKSNSNPNGLIRREGNDRP